MYHGIELAVEVSEVKEQASLQTTVGKLLVSEATIKIVTRGRKTQLPHIVRVRFVFNNESFKVFAGERTSDWVLNALKSHTAKIRLGNLAINARVSKVSEEERIQALAHLSSKYGRRVAHDWYSNSAMTLRLTPEGASELRAAVRGEGETGLSFADWASGGKQYYQSVSEAFDSASEEYDFTIGHNYVNTWIRDRSISELLRFVKQGDALVEVGCGTGAEAMEIVHHVSRIVATDISEKMLEILRRKTQVRQLTDKIIPLQLRASDIRKAGGVLDGGKADAVYSFNGALNCEPYVEEFVDGLVSILNPHGYFVCSVRNSLCLGEALSHAAVLQFAKMAPRKRQPIMVSVGGSDIPALYYSASAFARFFIPELKLLRIIALPAFLPPAYLSDYYVKFKAVGHVLERFDYLFACRFPFNRLGDQTLFVFQNRG